MKRLLVLCCVVLGCGGLSGCGDSSRDDAVTNVRDLMNTAASDIGGVKDSVKKAVEKQKKDGGQLDLSDAIKLVKNLEDTGKKAQDIKVCLGQFLGNLTLVQQVVIGSVETQLYHVQVFYHRNLSIGTSVTLRYQSTECSGISGNVSGGYPQLFSTANNARAWLNVMPCRDLLAR